MGGVADRAQVAWGVSTGESVLVFALVGVMAALSVSTVNEVLVKSAVTEASFMSVAAKVYWTERWAMDGPQETRAPAEPLPGIGKGGRYFQLADASLDDGAITFEFGDELAFMDGERITLRAATSAHAVLWICGTARAPRGFTARGENLTDTDAAYLPSFCRERS